MMHQMFYVYFLYAVTDDPIHLGRSPTNQCAGGLICPDCPGFDETVFNVTGTNATFVGNIGPPGGRRGYQVIVGKRTF